MPDAVLKGHMSAWVSFHCCSCPAVLTVAPDLLMEGRVGRLETVGHPQDYLPIPSFRNPLEISSNEPPSPAQLHAKQEECSFPRACGVVDPPGATTHPQFLSGEQQLSAFLFI